LEAICRPGPGDRSLLRDIVLDGFRKRVLPLHPDVATSLNNLARLLQDTNRLSEAEPLMRRSVAILLKFTRVTGHLHPNLRAGLRNYRSLLIDLSLDQEEIRKRISELAQEAGFDHLESYDKLLNRIFEQE